MKSMAIKKMMKMDDEIVENVGFSNKGMNEDENDDEKEAEEYPYCLRLYLGSEELKMLGIKDLPKLGSKMPMNAIVKVIGMHANENGQSLDLQIIAMELEQKKQKSVESTLYI